MELLGKPAVSLRLFVAGKMSLVICVFSPFAYAYCPCWFWQGADGPARILAWIIYGLSGLVVLVASLELGESLRVGLPSGKTRLKTTGLYSISRNPIYASCYPWFLSAGVLAPHPVIWALSLLSLYVHHRIILGEEAFLKKRFGSEWKAYCSQVPRYV